MFPDIAEQWRITRTQTAEQLNPLDTQEGLQEHEMHT